MYGNRVRDNSKKASKVKFWLRYLDSLRHDRKKFLICFSYNFEFTKGFCVLYPSKSYYKVASMICTIKCPWGLDQVKDGEGLWEVPISSPNGGKIFYLLKKKGSLLSNLTASKLLFLQRLHLTVRKKTIENILEQGFNF